MDRAVIDVIVADVEQAISAAFPPELAEPWDRIGLLAGDREAPVRGVVLALDPTEEIVRSTHERGANVLVTHHPAFLTPPAVIGPGRAGGSGVVFEALSLGVALINAHTNLDRDARAQGLIPRALGFEPERPLETTLQPRSLVTVFVPPAAAETVAAAMTRAGAGRIGDYEQCSFRTSGTGSFVSPPHGRPAVGTPGERTDAEETRIEMVCPRSCTQAVVSAAVSAHPYEEPLVLAADASIAPNTSALGMISVSGTPGLTLGALARHAATVFGVSPRVWGDAERPVERIATATGSAGSLVGAAIAGGADALVAGEVRYHDALDAAAAGLGIIELGHDASEWPLVALLEAVVRDVPGLDSTIVAALPPRISWWTASPRQGADG